MLRGRWGVGGEGRRGIPKGKWEWKLVVIMSEVGLEVDPLWFSPPLGVPSRSKVGLPRVRPAGVAGFCGYVAMWLVQQATFILYHRRQLRTCGQQFPFSTLAMVQLSQ